MTTRGHYFLDYHGPYAISTIDGATGAHELFEAATGHMSVTLTSRKGNADLVLRRFLVQRVYPHIIAMLSLTTDCDKIYGWGEQGSIPFKALINDADIDHRFIPAYTPNMNDGERPHHTLNRIMLHQMIQGGAPEVFWGWARLCAEESYNQLVGARATRFMGYPCSPDHALTRRPMDAGHIRPFLCLVHVLNESATITMRHLQRHGTAGLFVFYGHPAGVRGWWIWVPNECELRFSRNVRFHESVFPFLDGSLLWDANVMRATWRFPLYRHLTPFGSSRHTNLRINPDTMPSPRDPVHRSANDLPPYSFVRPMSQPVSTMHRVRSGQADPAQLHLPDQTSDVPGGVSRRQLTDPTTDRVAGPHDTSPSIPQTWTRNQVPGPAGATTLQQLVQQDVALTVDQSHTKTGEAGVRFRRYRGANSMSQLRALGATDADIRYDLRRGITTLRDAALSAAFAAYMLDSHEISVFGDLCDLSLSDSDSDEDADGSYEAQPALAVTDAFLEWRLDSPPSIQIVEALAGLSDEPLRLSAALGAKGRRRQRPQGPAMDTTPDDGMSVNACRLIHQVDPCSPSDSGKVATEAFAAYLSDVPEAWPLYIPQAVHQHGAAAMYTGIRPEALDAESAGVEPAADTTGAAHELGTPTVTEPDVTISILFAGLERRRNGLRSILIQFVRNQLGWIEGDLSAQDATHPMRVVTKYVKRSLGDRCSEEMATAAVQWCRTEEAASFIDPNGPVLPNDDPALVEHPSESLRMSAYLPEVACAKMSRDE